MPTFPITPSNFSEDLPSVTVRNKATDVSPFVSPRSMQFITPLRTKTKLESISLRKSVFFSHPLSSNCQTKRFSKR